jgi:hypothetical protein
MLDFLWNVGQQSQLREHERRVQQAGEKAKAAQDRVVDLEMKVARLTLLCEALWEIVKADGKRQDSDLIHIMSDLDLSDGMRDGKHRPAIKCSQCGRVYQHGRPHCVFCGEKNVHLSAFRKI